MLKSQKFFTFLKEDIQKSYLPILIVSGVILLINSLIGLIFRFTVNEGSLYIYCNLLSVVTLILAALFSIFMMMRAIDLRLFTTIPNNFESTPTNIRSKVISVLLTSFLIFVFSISLAFVGIVLLVLISGCSFGDMQFFNLFTSKTTLGVDNIFDIVGGFACMLFLCVLGLCSKCLASFNNFFKGYKQIVSYVILILIGALLILSFTLLSKILFDSKVPNTHLILSLIQFGLSIMLSISGFFLATYLLNNKVKQL